MIRRAPVARRGWLAHTPLLVVLLSGGLVMALSGEPAAYSGARQVNGAISDVVHAPVALSAASPAVLGLHPDAATSVRHLPDASLFDGLPATLTGMGGVSLNDRLGAHRLDDWAAAAAVLVPPATPSALEVLANHQNNRTARLRAQAWEASRRNAMPASVPAAGPVASVPASVRPHPVRVAQGARLVAPGQAPATSRAGVLKPLPGEAGLFDRVLAEKNTASFLARYYRRPADKVAVYVSHAFDTAAEAGLDPYLLTAIMSIESSLNPRAHSSKGAKGLMQVLVAVHEKRFKPYGGPSKAYDPEISVKVGAGILAGMIERTGSVEGALKHYVGAANMRHDGGYGAKVISMRERIWIASQGRKVPRKVELAGAIKRANQAHAAAVASVRTAGRSSGTQVAVN